MNKTIKSLALAAFVVLASVSFLTAQTVGYNSTTINTGQTGVFSPTFETPANSATVGTSGGTLTAAPTSTTLTDSGSAWTTNFPNAAQPYWIQMTSGPAIGRFFNITSNTGTVLTVEGNPSAAGVLSGNTYKIVRGETIASFFANSSIQGSTSAATASADKVFLFISGSWIRYYYDTTNTRWQRVGFTDSSNNIAISPNSAVLFQRVGNTSITLVHAGTVSTNHYSAVISTGNNFISTGYVSDQTLADTGLQTTSNWISSVDDVLANYSGADKVFIFVSGAWIQYYFNSTAGQWRRVGFTANAGTTNIPAGTPLLIIKGGASGVYTRASAL